MESSRAKMRAVLSGDCRDKGGLLFHSQSFGELFGSGET
jgi:hypothetical protein